jgi:hypothetical protein
MRAVSSAACGQCTPPPPACRRGVRPRCQRVRPQTRCIAPAQAPRRRAASRKIAGSGLPRRPSSPPTTACGNGVMRRWRKGKSDVVAVPRRAHAHLEPARHGLCSKGAKARHLGKHRGVQLAVGGFFLADQRPRPVTRAGRAGTARACILRRCARWCGASGPPPVNARPWRRVNSPQLLACQGMESTMVPSMSKISSPRGVRCPPRGPHGPAALTGSLLQPCLSASMNASRSPSSTFCVAEISTPCAGP